MQPEPIGKVLPTSFADLSAAVSRMRAELFGRIPELVPIDITDLSVPDDVLADIRTKNLRRVRDEVSLEDMTAEGSPYRTDEYFDDQFLEVLASIEDKYAPVDFVRQMVRMIEIFLNESAAFRAALVVSRVTETDAGEVARLLRSAIEGAGDDDTRRTLQLLLVDLSNGGDEPWVSWLPEPEQAWLRSIVEDYAA
jgi:hypothetical protein